MVLLKNSHRLVSGFEGISAKHSEAHIAETAWKIG